MKHADVYTERERGIQRVWDKFKDVIFLPIVKLLVTLGVSPFEISLLSGLFGVLSGFYIVRDATVAFWFLVTALLLDGIDGPLSRAKKTVSMRGELVDTFFDYVTLTANTVGLAAAGLVPGFLAVIYGALYTLLIVFSVVRNRLGISAQYTFRPKLYVYALFGVFVFTGFDIFLIAFLVFSASMLYSVIRDFMVLKKKF